ncbi:MULTISPECIES: VanZ family protein [Clostridium]|uniref:VanZ family protein n=1 Tax=Clostridium TaxID=1485 RepID=UPI000824E758|nr:MULTISPECIES: VanZ family protein [Clostridium]PJI07526.1 VanZ family protein [Clostridium sp. CT7]
MEKAEKIKSHKVSIFKSIVTVLSVIYIAALLKIILFKNVTLAQMFGEYKKMRSVNLIPFKSIFESFAASKGMGAFWTASNVFGNLIVFIPFGYLVPMMWKKAMKFKNILMLSAGLSLFFETFQYITGTGSSDIDDIMLNTMGAIIGYILLGYLKKFIKKDKIQYIFVIFVTILFLASGFFVAFEKYGVMLHLTKLHEVVKGGNDIPKSRADVFGKFIDGNESQISLNTKIEDSDVKRTVVNGKVKNKTDKVSESNINVLLNSSTKVYLQRRSYSDNTMTIVNTRMSKNKIIKISRNSWIEVWGKRENDKILASIIVVQAKE